MYCGNHSFVYCSLASTTHLHGPPILSWRKPLEFLADTYKLACRISDSASRTRSSSLSANPHGVFGASVKGKSVTCTSRSAFGRTSTQLGVSLGRGRRSLLELGRKHSIQLQTHAFNPQNGGGGDGGRTIFNLAGAGLLTYLTVTGRLNWLFDTLFSLWLVSAVLWWFAERSLVKGPCPNCGGEFQVFEFSLKEEQKLCPYCSQPFKLENKRFVRDEPQFSSRDSRQPFEGFGGFDTQPTSSNRKDKDSGVVVDIEAEVRDKE